MKLLVSSSGGQDEGRDRVVRRDRDPQQIAGAREMPPRAEAKGAVIRRAPDANLDRVAACREARRYDDASRLLEDLSLLPGVCRMSGSAENVVVSKALLAPYDVGEHRVVTIQRSLGLPVDRFYVKNRQATTDIT